MQDLKAEFFKSGTEYAVVNLIPRSINSFAAKLMVNVYDTEAGRIDRERSYSVELMESEVELFRDDIIELLNSICGGDGNGGGDESVVIVSANQIADAGKD